MHYPITVWRGHWIKMTSNFIETWTRPCEAVMKKDELPIRIVLMWSINPVQLASPRKQRTRSNPTVLRALFFLLLTKQLISQYFFNSLIRKSFFNLTHYQKKTTAYKLMFNYGTHKHKRTQAHIPLCVTGRYVCVCLCVSEKAEGVLQLWLAGGVGTVTDKSGTQISAEQFPASAAWPPNGPDNQSLRTWQANRKQQRQNKATFSLPVSPKWQNYATIPIAVISRLERKRERKLKVN